MLKRFTAITMILGLFVMIGSAQAQLSINKGLRGGLNFANVSVDPDQDFELKSRTGLAVGGYLEVDPVGPLGVQADVLFSQKGAKLSLGSEEATAKITYLEIPVVAKLSIPLAPTMTYNVHAGPAFCFKLSEGFDPEDFADDEDSFKSSDLGLVVGLGLTVNALISQVQIDARYTIGLSDINVEGSGFEAKNKALTILVGVGF